MKKMSLTSYVLAAILLITLFFGLYALGIPNVKARVVPLIASGFVFVLTVVELVREIRGSHGKKGESPQQEQASETAVSVERARLGAIYGWMFGFFAAIYILGFPVSIFLFVLLFQRLHGRGWIVSLFSAIVTAGAIYLLFVVILKQELFQGIVFEGFSIEHWIHRGRKAL
jgi:hypothetical protein